MKANKQPTIYGDGKQSRDFTYVADVVEADLLACTAEKAVGEVINIACGERYTLLKLVDVTNMILDKSTKPIFDKERVGEVKHSLANIEKSKKMLGFKVICGFAEGLGRIIGVL